MRTKALTRDKAELKVMCGQRKSILLNTDIMHSLKKSQTHLQTGSILRKREAYNCT